MRKKTRRLLMAGAVGVLVVAVVLAVVAWRRLPVVETLQRVLEWTSGIGAWGGAVVLGLYVVAALLLLPGSVLTISSGFLFGVVWGGLVATVGTTLGATAAFLTGRTAARRLVERWLAHHPKFRQLNAAVIDNGFRMVLLTQLSPLFPFNILNYAYGVTSVRIAPFVLATWLGMLPGTLLIVYLGSTSNDLAQIFAGGLEPAGNGRILKWIGLALAFAATAVVTLMARRAMSAGGKTANALHREHG